MRLRLRVYIFVVLDAVEVVLVMLKWDAFTLKVIHADIDWKVEITSYTPFL